VAGKNSHSEPVQNRLAEKFKPMLKNRYLASAVFGRLFREKPMALWLFRTSKSQNGFLGHKNGFELTFWQNFEPNVKEILPRSFSAHFFDRMIQWPSDSLTFYSLHLPKISRPDMQRETQLLSHLNERNWLFSTGFCRKIVPFCQ
jgi:hypothetical protein